MKRVYSIVLSIIFSLNIVSAQAMPGIINDDFKAWAGQTVAGITAWPGHKAAEVAQALPWKDEGFTTWTGNSLKNGFVTGLKSLDRIPGIIANNWRLSYRVPMKVGSHTLAFTRDYPGLATVTALSLTVGSYHLYSINTLWNKIDEFEAAGSGEGALNAKRFSFACWDASTWKTGKALLSNKEAVWNQLKQRVNFPQIDYKQPEIDVLSQAIQDMWPSTVSVKSMADALAQIISFSELHENDEEPAKKYVDNVDILSRIITEKLWFEQQLEYLATFTDMPKKITAVCNKVSLANKKEPLVECVGYINGLEGQAFNNLMQPLENASTSFAQKVFYQLTWWRPWKFRLFPWPEYAGQTYLKMYKSYAYLRALYDIVTTEVQKSSPKTTEDMVTYVKFILKAQLMQHEHVRSQNRKTTLLAAMIKLLECIHNDYYEHNEDDDPFSQVLVHLQNAQDGNNVQQNIGQAIGALNAQQN